MPNPSHRIWFKPLQRLPLPARRWLVFTCLTLTVAYVTSLALVLAGMELIGEQRALFAFCLFLPPLIWLAPLGILTPACLLVRPSLGLVHLLCAAAVLLGHMDFNWARRPAPAGTVITVVTNNLGQSGSHGILPFLEREKPDILVLQEAGKSIRELLARFPDWHHAETGEFSVISRFPITTCAPLAEVAWHDRAVAARFLLKISPGVELVVYNIHLPTPRDELGTLRGHGFRAELLRGGGIYSRRSWRQFGDAFRARLDLVRTLVTILEKEATPCLLAGDFNCPDDGLIYRTFARRYTDAFEASGRGYGFTFPGKTRNPLALFGPWLRLDYVFAGPHWQPIRCRVERRRPSQHRAVSASLVLGDISRKGEEE